MTFQLAACAKMLWRDRPMEWRASALKERGLGVGQWNRPAWDLAKLEKTGATFTIMNGYLVGRLAEDEGADMLLASARETAAVGKRLGVHRLNLHGTGLGDGGIPIWNRPELRINLDLYHTQIGEGDVIRWCEKCLPWIGEVQVADTPGRCEPGTGEMNDPAIAKALTATGDAGPVGFEGFAAGDPDTALTAFRNLFTM